MIIYKKGRYSRPFLYIRDKIANNIDVVIIFSLIFAVLIFPLFVSVSAYLNVKDKKLYFSIQLFSFIKILGGYIETISEGVIIHLTNKKALILEKKKFLSVRKKIKPLKDYHVKKIRFLLEIGVDKRELIGLQTAFLVNYATEISKWLIYNKKPYIIFDGKIDLYAKKEGTNLYINVVFLLNLLMIFLSFIKIYVEKIFYAIKRRKQQN